MAADQSANNGMFTDGETETFKVDQIPLSNTPTLSYEDASTGTLVKAASTQVSSLVRNEVELAKTELTGSVKRGAVGGIFFALALTVLLYSTFFFFFFLANGFQDWFGWSAQISYLTVFLFMLVLVALLAIAGVFFMKKIEKPEATMSSLNDLKTVMPGNSKPSDEKGMYT